MSLNRPDVQAPTTVEGSWYDHPGDLDAADTSVISMTDQETPPAGWPAGAIGSRILARVLARAMRRAGKLARLVAERRWRPLVEAAYRARLVPDSLVPISLFDQIDPDLYQDWIAACRPLGDAQRQGIRAEVAALKPPLLVSVVIADAGRDAAADAVSIASVRDQIYPHWELCRDGGAGDALLGRIKGDAVIVLPSGDRLAETALYEAVCALMAGAAIVYWDEDRYQPRTLRRHTPWFKPDWDPDLVLGQDYVGAAACYRREVLDEAGGPVLDPQGRPLPAQILRAAGVTAPGQIAHVASVLSHRRRADAEAFEKAPSGAGDDAALQALAPGAAIAAHPLWPSWRRVVWKLPDPPPLASIVIPTRDRAALLSRCLDGVLRGTDYPDIEVVVVDNGSTEDAALAVLREAADDARVRVLAAPGPFNFSALVNQGAAAARGAVLVLLNNDIEVRDAGWLRELVAQACRTEVGAVGARLLYPDGRVQHGGIVLGVGHPADGPAVAGHFGQGWPGRARGPFGHAVLARGVAANTAACLAVRRSLFDEAGGFDAENLPVSFNDVDFCLRLRERGYRNVFTPFAELIHHESASRGADEDGGKRARALGERLFMRQRWAGVLDTDPFYNKNFSRLDSAFRLSGGAHGG